MADRNENPNEKKKPYVKPELDSAIVYEASGTTCCKVTTATCKAATKGAIGKSANTSTTS
jgi:hypothetical protein